MKREPYDIACLAAMLIQFLTTVGVTDEESIDVLRAAENMLVQTRRRLSVSDAMQDAETLEAMP